MNGSRDPRTHPAVALPSWLSRLLSLLLVLGLLVSPGSAGSSEALGLPGRSPRQSGDAPPTLASSAPSHLQEVAPPQAVQQLQEALAGREPHVEILSPADETLLPPGPWTLRLRVHDWPLVDGGELGLGPHLVVQVDDDEPLQVTSTEITMAALAPGSHRLTVFAARPWGEAAKNPGAWCQIRLHRTAANPLGLPEPGRAQLIAVSPGAQAAAEPLLLDWLLLDAPLQNLRSDDARWRLRITINGDGFVVDRQTPLWLKGWRLGRNAIRLELLDGRGEPLNPPYNSLVREVELGTTSVAASWQRGPLSTRELAILLGEAETEAPAPSSAPDTTPPNSPELPVASEPEGLASAAGPTQAATAPSDQPTSEAGPIPAAGVADQANSPAPIALLPNPERTAALEPPSAQLWHDEPNRPGGPDASSGPDQPSSPNRSERLNRLEPPAIPETAAGPSPPPSPRQSGSARQGSRPSEAADLPPPPSGPLPQLPAPAPAPAKSAQASLANQPALAAAEPAAPDQPLPGTGQATAVSPQQPGAASLSTPLAAGQPSPSSSPDSSPLPTPWPEAIPAESQRLRPTSAIEGPAREQVNPAGTMVQAPRRGPLAGLRERLLP